MFGYVNTRGTRNMTVFQVNATGGGWMETSQRRLAAAGRQLPHALRVRPRRGHRLLPHHRRAAATRSSPAPTTSAARPSPPTASSSSSATSTPPKAPRPTPRAGPSPTSGRSSSPEPFRSLKQQKGRPREVALFVACRACRRCRALAREGEAADFGAEVEEGDAERRRRTAAGGWCRSCRGACWPRGRRASPSASRRKSTREKSRSLSARWVASASVAHLARRASSGIVGREDLAASCPGVYLHS